MANTTTNMGLTLNVVGITQDPTWSTNINGDWSIIDAHDHSVGKGAQVTPAGLNINSDLSFNFNNVTSVRSWRMQNQSAALSLPADINCGYFVSGNFYINNASGTAVQITNGAGLNFSSLGTIGGDYGQPGVTAAVSYSNTTKYYTFTQSSNVTAPMFVGTVSISYPTAGAQAVSLAAPSSTTAYTITLPAAAPTSASVMTFDTSGNASFTPYTSADTPSTVVTRDSSGNINAEGLSVALLTAPGGTVALVGNETVSGSLTASATVQGNYLVSTGNLSVSGAAAIGTGLTVGSTAVFSGPIIPSAGIQVNSGTALNLKQAQFSGALGISGTATLTVSGTVIGINGVYTPGGAGNSYFIWPSNVQSNFQSVGAYSPTSSTVFLQNFLVGEGANYNVIITYY